MKTILNQTTEILRIREALEEQAARLNPVREGYLENLRMQLESGKYRIDGRKIALKMVQDTIDGLLITTDNARL